MCLALVMVIAGGPCWPTDCPVSPKSLGRSQSEQQWIVDAYALTLARMLLPARRAGGDRFGRRGALIAGWCCSVARGLRGHCAKTRPP